jgi:uncharacterized protein YegP (UPF0339 family)
MAHKFVIKHSSNGEYIASFEYNGEKIFWTETYKSKSSAQNAIDSIKKNGPMAEVHDAT